MINDLFKLEKKIKDGMAVLVDIRDELKRCRKVLEEIRDNQNPKITIQPPEDWKFKPNINPNTDGYDYYATWNEHVTNKETPAYETVWGSDGPIQQRVNDSFNQ